MPVLYGVFFYMGFSALRGQQVSSLTLYGKSMLNDLIKLFNPGTL